MEYLIDDNYVPLDSTLGNVEYLMERILLDVWDRSIHNRINRWVMVAVNVAPELDSPESVERFESFLSELYPQIDGSPYA